MILWLKQESDCQPALHDEGNSWEQTYSGSYLQRYRKPFVLKLDANRYESAQMDPVYRLI